MTDTVDALIFDLLECVACKERRYADVIEAWRCIRRCHPFGADDFG